MSDIDSNGPTIEVQIDTKGIEEGAKKADILFDEAIHSINENIKKSEQNFTDFGEVIKSVFTDALRQQADYIIGMERFDRAMEAGKRAEEDWEKEKEKRRKEAQKREDADRKRREDDEKRRVIALERQEMEQRNEQLRQQQQLIAGTKNMAIALLGVASAGATLRKALDFSDNLTSMDLGVQSLGGNLQKFIQFRNAMTEKGMSKEGASGFYSNVGKLMTTWRNNPAGLDDKQSWMINQLMNENPSINPNMSTDEAVIAFSKAISKFNTDPSFSHIDHQTKAERVQLGFGVNGADSEVLLSRSLTKADLDRQAALAKKEASGVDGANKINQQKRRGENLTEANMAGVIGKMSPEATQFMNAMNNFLEKHGEMAMMVKLLGDFGIAVFGIVGTLKLLKGGLPGGGLLSKGWNIAKNAGGAGWRWGKSALGWAAEHPGEIAKTGGKGVGRTLAAPLFVAYELSFDAQSASANDEPIRDIHGNLSRTGRKQAIEKALHTKIQQSFWSNDFYVQTKDGNYIYLDSGFYEPIENIKQRIKNNISNPQQTGGLGEALLPTAHADTPSYDVTNGHRRSAYPQIGKPEQKENALKMYETLRKEGGLTHEQAIGDIAGGIKESQLNPNALGDHGKAFGLYQWREARQAIFKRLYGFDIHKATFEQQMKFHIWELNNNYKKAGNALRKARTEEDAVRVHTIQYEQPADKYAEAERRIGNINTANQWVTQARASRKTNISSAQQPNIIDNRIAQARSQNNNSITNNNAGDTHANNNVTINIHAPNGNATDIAKETDRRFQTLSLPGINGVG